ncbi:MAG: peptidylprolyl isomerase [Gelidibacter sp.]
MLLKTINLKFIINSKLALTFLALLSINIINSQEIIADQVAENTTAVDTLKSSNQRVKVDGVVAVVGDFVILDSDIDKEFLQLQARGVTTTEISRCELFGKLLEDKLYAHSAIQDSITVKELEIRSNIDQQIAAFLEETNGSMEELLKFYNKDSEQALREEMFEINKNQQLAYEMQRKIVEDIEVTPEEVREYFNSIPKDERPVFGTELKVAQIVVIPKITEVERQKAINKLKEFKADILENGASFTTKATFYSDDMGSRKTGGKLPPMNRSRPQMVKEFRDVAFSLEEGEISEPFETDFGYHIIWLEKIRGQEYDVRHILIRPEVTQEAIKEAKAKIDTIRARIVRGEIKFADAARELSDEKETKQDGGQLINPKTQDYNFELTKMDPELYSQIQNLKDNEVSLVLQDEDRINRIKFKILTVTDRVDEHEADFARDYLKIKNLTIQDKQFKEIGKWQDEKIKDTYININGEYRDCNFTSNWLKKEK